MVVVAEVVRSGMVESRHHGSVAGLAADGSVVLSVGDITSPVFGRSSNKPMQAVAMVTAGLQLPSDLLAVVAASHSGEPAHLDAVRRLLATAGLREDQLANTADLPLDEHARNAVIAAHASPSALLQNCSGKHAGMLVTCVVNGWPTAGYLDPDHPLQRAVTTTVERLCGERVAHVGVDGCGAPVHAISLVGLARAFRTIATEPVGSAGHAVAGAIRRHPFLLGGSGRDVTLLLDATPGLIAKDGAEGVYAAATTDGRAVALKIDDGASRARACVLLEALTALGVDVEAARAVTEVAVLGHGRPVGVVRACPLN